MNKILNIYTTANHNSAVFTEGGMLGKIVLYANGATAVATVYDNAGTASGKRLCKLTALSSEYEKTEEWSNGLQFNSGLFLLLTGTGAEIKIEKIEF